MKILFLGLLYNRDDEKMLLSRSTCGLQGGANTFQWNLIDGFDGILDPPIQIINSLPVGAYPRYYKQLFIASKTWSHMNGAIDKEIGYINLPGFKQIIRQYKFYKEVKHWCKENTGNDLVLISYSLYLPYLKVLSSIKRTHKNIFTCIIVPDLPNAFDIDDKDHSIKNSIWKYIGTHQYKLAKRADMYVLLTKEMVNQLDIKEKPFVIVEGISNPQILQAKSQTVNNTIIIMYSGALNQRFGLDKLVKAFQNISYHNYQLWICGAGDYQDEIEKAAKEDTRIKYFGYVVNDKLHEMHQQATLLVNPRPNDGEYTKYSFPSKTIEYMSNGKPVLMFKLDGIPDEYDDYLYYFKENTVDSIKETILTICQKSTEELESRGKEVFNFIMHNKNGNTQANKVFHMLQTTTIKKKIMNEKRLPIVLQINITCQYGSTGKIVEEIHNHITKNGFCSSIAYSAFESNLESSFKIENKLENYMRRALNRYMGRKYVHSSLGTLRLIRKIKQLHPDIIHLHNIQQNSIHFPMLLKFLIKYNVPVVYTLHDCWAFTGGCHHFVELECDGYQTGCFDCKLNMKDRDNCNKTTDIIYEEKNNLLHALNKLQIICVSNWLKSCAEISFMKDLPLQVIYNGVDTNIFKPIISNKREELQIGKDEFIILGVANNWDQRKGLNTFFELAVACEKSCRIVLVGISPKNCPPNIIAVERTDNIFELVKFYSCADVFFNASKEETFGLAAAEAMACGTPVIAYDSTACGEVISSDTGILLKSFQMEDLLTAIDNVRKMGKETYSEKCINRINYLFSNEEMLQQYLNLYEQLMSKPD